MDIISTILSRNQTDRTINLHDYGIDIVPFVGSGGGEMELSDAEKAKAFLNDVRTKKPNYVLCNDPKDNQIRVSVTGFADLQENCMLSFSLGLYTADLGKHLIISTNTVIFGNENYIDIFATSEFQEIQEMQS